MNGAESLIRTAKAAGVEVCFTNPGTTEMHLVAALDAVPGMRGVLGLFEGVCTGAADGYARMTGLPALTLLHLGPGFANGIANLHNARRARSPVVNLIGDHATWHVDSDPPLASDIESLARPVSRWVHTSVSAEELPRDGARAIAEARHATGGGATLIVPADAAWGESPGPVPAFPVEEAPLPDVARVDEAAQILRSGASAIVLVGGHGLHAGSGDTLGRIQGTSGCRVFCEVFPARMERGAGRPTLERMPYFPEWVIDLLGEVKHLILVGALEPVGFFGYPDVPSRLVPDGCRVHTLATPEEDVPGALEALAEALGASAPVLASAARPDKPQGPIDPGTLGAAIASTQAENTILMDEGITAGLPYFLGSSGCPPYTYLSLTGGAIGLGLPCATGAAIACPERPVIALQADGSAMYTLQSLWTHAREGLDITTVLCANRQYRILRIELGRTGIAEPGPQAQRLTDLGSPTLDWVALGRGLGVPSVQVERAEDLVRELERASAEPGPHLIEALL